MAIRHSYVGVPRDVTFIAGNTLPVVITDSGNIYVFFIGFTSVDPCYVKSADGGVSWSDPVVIDTIAGGAISVWYDRWSGVAADNIHVAYTDNNVSDVFYKSLDTTSDTLSARSTVFAGASVAAGGTMSICRSRGGNLYVAVMIDAGTEGGFFRSTAIGASASWSSRTSPFEAETQDQIILMPGFAADDQDMMAFFWDASADEISRKLYDDSANSWGETSIATSMVDVAAATTYPHFAACVDLANNRNLLVAWSAVDLANADLRCWHITEAAITEVTNVVLNSTDDQGLCAIGIDLDSGYWHVLYYGLSTGAQTWSSNVSLQRKISTDQGSTWGTETTLSPTDGAGYNVSALWMSPWFRTRWAAATRCPIGPGYMLVSFEAPPLRPAVLINSDAVIR